MSGNVEIKILGHKNGRYHILEESKNKGKGGAKPTIPKFKVTQLDLYLNTT